MFELREDFLAYRLSRDGLNYHVKTVRITGIPFLYRWLGVRKEYCEYFGRGKNWTRVVMRRCDKLTRKWLGQAIVDALVQNAIQPDKKDEGDAKREKT